MPSQLLTGLVMFPFKSFSFGATGQGPPLDDTKVRDLGGLEKLHATAHDHDFTPGRRVRLCGVGRINVLAQNHPQRGTGHLGWRLRHGRGSAEVHQRERPTGRGGGRSPFPILSTSVFCSRVTALLASGSNRRPAMSEPWQNPMRLLATANQPATSPPAPTHAQQVYGPRGQTDRVQRSWRTSTWLRPRPMRSWTRRGRATSCSSPPDAGMSQYFGHSRGESR